MSNKILNYKALLAVSISICLSMAFGFFILKFFAGTNNDEAQRASTIQEDLIEEAGDDDNTSGADSSNENTLNIEDKEPKVAKVYVTGDIMVHDEQYIGAFHEETDAYDFDLWFEKIKPIIKESDLMIGNFETTLAGEDKGYKGYPLFNAPDEIAQSLKDAGFDVLTTSNNHALDMGIDGVIRTVEQLNDVGITPVGTYTEATEDRFVIQEVNGINIGILAFTEHLNGMDQNIDSQTVNAHIDVIDQTRIENAVNGARESGADIILAYMHWGPEYKRYPHPVQEEYAQMLANIGVEMIIGSHPHVIQKTDEIDSENGSSFIVYSLGNTVSNQRLETIGPDFEPSEDGVILQLEITKDEKTTLTNVDYTPTWVYRYSRDGNGVRPFNYEILPVENHLNDASLPEDIRERLYRSKERTDERLELSTNE